MSPTWLRLLRTLRPAVSVSSLKHTTGGRVIAMILNNVVSFILDNAKSTQGVLFVTVIVAVWLTERIVLAQSTIDKLRHTSINAVFMTGAMPIQIFMILLCAGIATWATKHHIGLVWLLPNAESPLIKYGLMFFVLDFLDYVYHFTSHRVSLLWRLHLVHHTDPTVDVSTTFREHPGETLIRNCFLILWVVLSGASVEVLILRQTFETFANVSQHTMFRLPPLPGRVLGWLFVTPNLHHTHHHFQAPGTNCNYGDVFSIWDRLFGTYVDLSHEETVFGLDTHMEGGAPTGILHLLGLGRLIPETR
jgi:sterol desaturase/sphingolipid hydroxylase (fatty acid hydroxylase superfamily)